MNEHRYCLCFARAFGRPLLFGRLRRAPQDFVVSEELGFEPAGLGEHVYLLVRKTGANTHWVAGEIARCAGVGSGDVGYAGRKDRHAVAQQWFSCRLPGRLAPDWRLLRGYGIEVLASRRHLKKLRTGMHAANAFDITVRELGAHVPMARAIADLRQRLAVLAGDGFPNYFGEQRFGLHGANLERADELLRGGQCARHKRGMYISAARSYLFNRQLSRLVADGDWKGRGDDGWLWGASRQSIDTAEDPEFADWRAGLERLGVKAMRRPWRVRPSALRWELAAGSLRLSFELPAGSFATSLIRELVDGETGDMTTGEALGQTA